MQVYKIDSENFYTHETYFTDNPKENEISIYPCDFYKPKWDENKKQWVEGATQEEIIKWKEDNKVIDKICLTQEQQVIQDLSIELAKLKLQLLNK